MRVSRGSVRCPARAQRYSTQRILGPDEFRSAERYLRSEVPVDRNDWFWGNSIDGFNDRDETTFEDVRQLFKRAIKAARGDGT